MINVWKLLYLWWNRRREILVVSRKTVSGIMLTLLLMGMLTLAFKIQPVKAQGSIYIRADGSVDPPTAPVSSVDNVTYTFTGNINDSLVVERNNIMIDGAGYTVQGTGAFESRGILFSSINNVTIINITVQGFYECISLYGSSLIKLFGSNIMSGDGGWAHCSVKLISSSNNIIKGNNITSRYVHGIRMESSSNNVISENNITNNGYAIQLVSYSSSNTVYRNNITNNDYGIVLDQSSNNTITGNVMNNNIYNFAVDGTALSHFINSIDISNLVDGKPVYYLVNQKDLAMNPATCPEIGYLALINCTNIIVQGLTLTNNWQGLLLAYTSDSNITYNIMVNNYLGIGIWYSSNNNSIVGNNITKNYGGVYLETSSTTSIDENSISDNVYGVWFYQSSNNNVSRNNITKNDYGAFIWASSDNLIYHNNFANKWDQAFPYYSRNVWDNGYPSGGNYWSDYSGVDLYSGPYQNETGKDGIGDSPYIIDVNNQDRYPLLTPFGQPTTLYVPTRYQTIQEAINAASLGDTIFVYNGTYYENVVVNKTVSLIGENRNGIIVDGNGTGTIFYVTVGGVRIENLAIQNGEYGVTLYISDGNIVENCIIANNSWHAIWLYNSNNNVIAGNTMLNNRAGIFLSQSSDNVIVKNTMMNNWGGIGLEHSNNNNISHNSISLCDPGVTLEDSDNNTIIENIVTLCEIGVITLTSNANFIYHNNFINNSVPANTYDSFNAWNNSYPSGGNYWSDHVCVDVKSGLGQDLPGSDGIGDTPYVIDSDNVDHYPLMNPYGVPPPVTYTLTITTTVGGTTTPAPGTYSYTANSTVQVTAIPDANYLFDHWELDTVKVGSVNPQAVLMDRNHTLKAAFSPKPAVPVGGYSLPIKGHITASPLTLYLVTIAILATVFTATRRKIPKKK
jgi:parallel beta-helix repeat protein